MPRSVSEGRPEHVVVHSPCQTLGVHGWWTAVAIFRVRLFHCEFPCHVTVTLPPDEALGLASEPQATLRSSSMHEQKISSKWAGGVSQPQENRAPTMTLANPQREPGPQQRGQSQGSGRIAGEGVGGRGSWESHCLCPYFLRPRDSPEAQTRKAGGPALMHSRGP